MKKVSKLMWTLAIGAVLVACNSTDSLINKFEKACKAGDEKKAEEIYKQLEKKQDELSIEQRKRLVQITADFMKQQQELEDMENALYD